MLFAWGHAIFAGLMTGGFLVLGVACWHLRRGRNVEMFRSAAKLAIIVVLPVSAVQLWFGSHFGIYVTDAQPMKIAATEALWDTEQPAGFSLFQIGGFTKSDQTPSFDIEIPWPLSFLATGSSSGKVDGINPLQSQAEQQHGRGNYIPDIRLVYWSMRVMAYLGTLSVLLALWGGWLLWRKKLEGAKWFQRAARRQGDRVPVPLQLRRLDPHRGRAAAVGRLRAPQDRGRRLRLRQRLDGRTQPRPIRLLYTVLGLVDLYLMRRYARLDPPEVGGEGEEGRRNRRRPIEMTPETLWFCLLCVLWTGYFITEGFDFGVGMLLLVLGRSEEDRRTMFESIGPVWDGNEVWLVIAGGATFAAFPVWYATMFSGSTSLPSSRSSFCSSFASSRSSGGERLQPLGGDRSGPGSAQSARSALHFLGIALASLLNGVPIASDQTFAGSFGDLFSAYTILAGIAVCLLFALHGAVFLTLRTLGDLRERARRAAARPRR